MIKRKDESTTKLLITSNKMYNCRCVVKIHSFQQTFPVQLGIICSGHKGVVKRKHWNNCNDVLSWYLMFIILSFNCKFAADKKNYQFLLFHISYHHVT